MLIANLFFLLIGFGNLFLFLALLREYSFAKLFAKYKVQWIGNIVAVTLFLLISVMPSLNIFSFIGSIRSLSAYAMVGAMLFNTLIVVIDNIISKKRENK